MGVGLAVVAIGLVLVFSGTKGAHLELQGKVLKARTGSLDPQSSIAIIDFRVTNPSDIPFVVRDVSMSLEKQDGTKVEGQMISKQDAKTLFQADKFLGVQYNEILTIKDRVPPHGMIDRMAAARFDGAPQADMDQAKSITLVIQDMDGPEFRVVHKLP